MPATRTRRRPTPVVRTTAWSASSRELFTDPGTGKTRPVWRYEHIDDSATTWDVLYQPTGQRALYFASLDAARQATADGSLLAQFAAADAAVMALPCPGGCGGRAVALVVTAAGPAPVCAAHRPVIEGRGYLTRNPA